MLKQSSPNFQFCLSGASRSNPKIDFVQAEGLVPLDVKGELSNV